MPHIVCTCHTHWDNATPIEAIDTPPTGDRAPTYHTQSGDATPCYTHWGHGKYMPHHATPSEAMQHPVSLYHTHKPPHLMRTQLTHWRQATPIEGMLNHRHTQRNNFTLTEAIRHSSRPCDTHRKHATPSEATPHSWRACHIHWGHATP